MTNVSSVSMKHNNSHVGVSTLARTSNVIGGEFLAIVSRNNKLFEVPDTKLGRSRYICPGVWGHVGRVYQSPGENTMLADRPNLLPMASAHNHLQDPSQCQVPGYQDSLEGKIK